MANEPYIDVTALAHSLGETAVLVGTKAALAAVIAVPGLGWIASVPVFTVILNKIITWILKRAEETIERKAMNLGTALQQAHRASRFTAASNKLKSLPPETSEEVYAKAEQDKISAFRELVRIAS